MQKQYDGTTVATLAGGNYQLTGVVSGESVSLNNPVSGTYDTKNAGTGKTVTVGGLQLNGADSGNYVLVANTLSGNIGIVTARSLTASLIATAQKTYDGSATATLTGANYQLSNVVSGDSVALNNPAAGSYDTKNVGTGKSVSVGGLALAGADQGNYVLAATSVSANIGVITAAQLTASLTGTVQKTFDGTTTATLAPANYQLSGVFAGDNAVLNNPAAGSYDTNNVGTGKVVTVRGLAIGGVDSGNYALASATISAAVGVINNVQIDKGVVIDLIDRPFIVVTPPPAFPPPIVGMNDATGATNATEDDFGLSNMVADSLGESLNGEEGSVRSSTVVLIEGLLRQFEPPPGGFAPRAVPAFGQIYSSWGNEAFWQ